MYVMCFFIVLFMLCRALFFLLNVKTCKQGFVLFVLKNSLRERQMESESEKGCETYQTTKQIMICSLSQRNVSHVALNNLLGHVCGAVEHHIFSRPPIQLLDFLQKLNRFAGIIYSLNDFHLKCFISRI